VARTFTTEQPMARSLSTGLPEAIESFLRARWDLKPNTLRTYRLSLARFASQHHTLADLTAENVDDYLASIAPHRTMARNDAIALRQLAQWATKTRIFLTDPLEAVSLPRGHNRRRRPYSADELRAIIAAASDTPLGIRDRAIVITALSTGLRPAELHAIELEDVDLRDGFLRVRPETTKTASGERVVPLDPQCVEALDRYLCDERPRNAPGPFWRNAHGDPLAFGGFMAIWHRLRDRLAKQGIEVQAYRARHTAITSWAVEGVPTSIIQQMAGHKSIVTTQAYIGRASTAELARYRGSFSRRFGRVAS